MIHCCGGGTLLLVLDDLLRWLVLHVLLHSSDLLLTLLGERLGRLDVEAVGQNGLHLLELETREFRVAEVAEHGGERGEAREERERARRRDVLQHGQERGRNDQGAGPVGRSGVGRADTSDVLWEQLGLLPWDGTDAEGVEGGEHDDEHDDDNAPRGETGVCHDGVVAVELDADEVERDGADGERHGHAGQADEQDDTSADLVDGEERDQREDEVGTGDNDGDSTGVGEADGLEDGTGEVHERVPTGELLDGLETTRDDQRAEIGRHGVQLDDGVPHLLALVLSWDGVVEGAELVDLLLDDLVGGVDVTAAEDLLGLLVLALHDVVTGGVGQKEEEGELQTRGDQREADEDTPAVVDVGETRTDTVRDELATGEPQGVDDCESTSDHLGRDLTDEQWGDEGTDTDTEAHDESAGGHLPELVGRDLDNGSDNEHDVGEHDAGFTAEDVGGCAGENTGDECTERSRGSDDLLVAVGQNLVVKVLVDGNKGRGDVTCVVTEQETGERSDESEDDDEGRDLLVECDHDGGVVLVVDRLDEYPVVVLVAIAIAAVTVTAALPLWEKSRRDEVAAGILVVRSDLLLAIHDVLVVLLGGVARSGHGTRGVRCDLCEGGGV